MRLRLDWSELDLLGHINNVSYIQAARINYWEQCGLSPMFHETPIGPILLSTGCQFIKPLFYPGEIEIHTVVEFAKTTSYGLHHRISNAAGELVAEAHDVVVNFDFTSNTKVPMTDEFRAKLHRHQVSDAGQ